MSDKGQKINALVALSVNDEEIVNRILLRGETSGRPDDNDEAIVRNRIQVYNDETAPVFDYYAKSDSALQIEGLGTIEEIFDRLCQAIDKLK